MSYHLTGKVAWVTGASGAIGAAVCRHLAEQGVRVAAMSRTREKLEDLVSRLPGQDNTAITGDVTEQSNVENAMSRILSRYGGIDILVNSTTMPIFKPFLELDDSEWISVLDAKLLAYVRTCRAAIPAMIERGGGTIVNVSGRGGHQPGAPSHFAGSCTNGAVNTLTKAIALHFGANGIRANTIAPGPVVSERYDQIAAANDRIEKPGENNSPVNPPNARMATPDDIANIVTFFASDESKHLNGTLQQADGGATSSI